MSASNPSRLYLLVVLSIGLLAAGGYFLAEVYFFDGDLGFPLDDSWIHLQFAHNLHLGDGLTYNPGEPVAGSTAPLWTAVLALLHLLPGSVIVWTKLVGIVLYLAGLHAVFVLSRELGLSSGLAAFAGAMTALTSWLLWSAVSGMEVPLFIWLSLWGVVFHLRERVAQSASTVALPLFAMSALARPEGVLLLVLAAGDRLLEWERPDGSLRLRLGRWQAVAKGVVFTAVLLVPVAIFNHRISGLFLPTTFSAKSSGVRNLLPDLRFIHEILSIFLRPHPYLTFLAAAGCLVLIERLGHRRGRGLLPGLWLVALPLAYSTLGATMTNVLVGNFGRYFYPLFPFVVIAATLAIERAAESIGPRLAIGRTRLPLRAALVVLVVWPTMTGAIKGSGLYLQAVSNIQDGDVQIAKWLGEHVDPRALLAVNDVGAIKYMLPNSVIDMAGIIHPEVMQYMEEAKRAGSDWRTGVLRFLEERKPDYLVIFPTWYPELERLDARYQPQFELEVLNNVALGGNSIVIYRTPWTRYPLRSSPPDGESPRPG